MATTVSEIISQAMIFIDDVRLKEQLNTNPAQFYRTMSAYVQAAMPMLNRPPELFSYISKEYVEPQFDATEWTATEQSLTEETIVQTGFIGYDLCSVVIRSEDGMYETPYSDYTYDAETGDITFAVQSQAGTIYVISVYKDGSVADLTYTMMKLFAQATTLIWYARFDNNWLNQQMKIHDSNYSTVNESSYTSKLSEKVAKKVQSFAEDLRKYEQDVTYNRVIPDVLKASASTLI